MAQGRERRSCTALVLIAMTVLAVRVLNIGDLFPWRRTTIKDRELPCARGWKRPELDIMK